MALLEIKMALIKNLFFLLIMLLVIACSNDDPQPVTTTPNQPSHPPVEKKQKDQIFNKQLFVYNLTINGQSFKASELQYCEGKTVADCKTKSLTDLVDSNQQQLVTNKDFKSLAQDIKPLSIEDYVIDQKELKKTLAIQHYFSVARCRFYEMGQEAQKYKFGFLGDWIFSLQSNFVDRDENLLLVVLDRQSFALKMFKRVYLEKLNTYSYNDSFKGLFLIKNIPNIYKKHFPKSVQLAESIDIEKFNDDCDSSYGRAKKIPEPLGNLNYGFIEYSLMSFMPLYDEQLEMDRNFVGYTNNEIRYFNQNKYYTNVKEKEILEEKLYEDFYNLDRFPDLHVLHGDPLWTSLYGGLQL